MTDDPLLNGGVPDEIVRRMPHGEWLDQFATILGMQRPNGPPMTALRQGAIAKLKLAARYVRLLEEDLKRAKEENDGTEGR